MFVSMGLVEENPPHQPDDRLSQLGHGVALPSPPLPVLYLAYQRVSDRAFSNIATSPLIMSCM
ncbi:hypothetical protein K443DRAFT_179642 [Laccaria amethystina LaAM-08-1]|uniref:Uncharacterized protein n=1 Tax=Laccaria amethystina LaAM-08-1 TaxID=1095629 RepID=A0A0C9XC82_9AGAR|nr:hypothetical protein K443DRAFT_179642 [Laccaria amethystina LaAM-08-1]